MRVTREQAAENRERIVAAAARLFRERGFDGVGVDAITEAAGLTHGGFYRHFASKDELAAEAVAWALARGAEKQSVHESLAELVSSYLSPRHLADCGDGCALAALGGDIARQGAGARRCLTASVLSQLDRLAGLVRGRSAETRRRRAIAALSGMVGALTLARAVDDPILSAEILAAARAEFGGAPA